MASIQGIYIALLGRPADPAGLASWEAITDGGKDTSNMIAALTGTAEYQALYEGKESPEIIAAIYLNLFGREPDAAGLAYFVDGLNAGTFTLDTIAVAIFDGAAAHPGSADLAYIQNKEIAANLFTTYLSEHPDANAAYNFTTHPDQLVDAKTYLANVTSNPSTIPTTATIEHQVQVVLDANEALPPSEGGGPVDPGNGGGGGGNQPPVLFHLTGTDADDNTTGPGAHWVTDRSALAGIHSVTTGLGTTVDPVLAFTLTPAADTSFTGYQGAKFAPASGEWDATHGSEVSYQFYVDSSWGGDGVADRSGVWIQMQNDASSLDSGGRFSIAEYLDADAITAARASGEVIEADFTGGFRFWSSANGWEGHINTSATGWVDLNFEFGTTAHTWTVNGVEYSTTGSANEVTQIDGVFVQSRANGADTTFHYDDIQLTGTSLTQVAEAA